MKVFLQEKKEMNRILHRLYFENMPAFLSNIVISRD
jgi:hypothetical protein